ncbi:Aminopeptidase N OS=Streptomyces microflavus OX=1919 GN=Smic_72010 PE=3 SV=1 [Streptomyces microflavus]
MRVNGKKASYTKSGTQELEITPAGTLAKGKDVSVVVRYARVSPPS